MARQKLNQGTFPTGAGGDNWRTGSAKLDDGIGELYSQFGADDQGVLPSALPISKGGTGATTEAEVRLNLDVFSRTEVAQAIEAAIIPPDPENTVTKSYVDSAALKAENNAKSAADLDATTKANNALSSSKTYTDQQIGNIGTTQINKGGTGATNTVSARTNLDVYSKTEVNQAIANAKPPDAGTTQINKGGTGATTAAEARTNLDVPSKGDLQNVATAANSAKTTADAASVTANNAEAAVAGKLDKSGIDPMLYMLIPWPKTVPPSGYMVVMGQALLQDEHPILYSLYGPRLIDPRGQVLRGWDNGRGIDVGRSILTEQGDAIRNITGTYQSYYNTNASEKTGAFYNAGSTRGGSGGNTAERALGFDASLVVPTASENRVKNIAINYIIKIG